MMAFWPPEAVARAARLDPDPLGFVRAAAESIADRLQHAGMSPADARGRSDPRPRPQPTSRPQASAARLHRGRPRHRRFPSAAGRASIRGMDVALEAVARAYRTVRETGASDCPAYLAVRDAYLVVRPEAANDPALSAVMIASGVPKN